MKKILMREDDKEICAVTKKYFSGKGTEITCIYGGEDTIDRVLEVADDYELVLLDIMLPGTDGFTICRSLRRHSDIPVVFITARGREEDILYGYDLGCDDYIVKPFMLAALYAKCEALVRRSTGTVLDTVLECGGIMIDTRSLICRADGSELELPPKEFAILKYLMEHENWTVDRDTLLNRVWGSDYFGSDRVVDNHIKKLRKALGKCGSQIKTAVGKGYKITKK